MPSYTWPLTPGVSPPAPAEAVSIIEAGEAVHTGPLSIEDLMALWESVTDRGYNRPLLEVGDGGGLEVISQAAAQYERLSEAVDRSTQSLYILPWSGQTDEPASGPKLAATTLTLTRTAFFEREILFIAGQVLIQEETTDFGPDGPQTVNPGRRFVVSVTSGFGPGESGPQSCPVVAERPGYSYNNVAPGTIVRFVQPGGGFANDNASIVAGQTGHLLIAASDPDVPIPEHVGQYVLMTGGSNIQQIRRVIAYDPPVTEGANLNGGTLTLAPTAIMHCSLLAGTFIPGELVQQFPSGATGTFQHATSERIVVDRIGGIFTSGAQVVVGAQSGAQALIDMVDQTADMTSETGTASWKVLKWDDDLGIVATNAEQPSGGRLGMLDELGSERKVFRAPGEEDDPYRKRVSTPADTVSPNAILRAANRVVAPYGTHACLREVGLARLRGLFFDGGDRSSNDPRTAFAYDLDAILIASAMSITGNPISGEPVVQIHTDGTFATGTFAPDYASVAIGAVLPSTPSQTWIVAISGTFVNNVDITGQWSGAVFQSPTFTGGLQPRDAYKLALDYADFRAFFLLSIPPLPLGDFGCFYDSGDSNAYDCAPYLAFFDGFPATGASLLRTIWQEVYDRRAGGVGFDLVEDANCESL